MKKHEKNYCDYFVGISGQSKYYSDNLSENVKRGIRQKIRRGEHGWNAPVGYVYNHKLRNIEPDIEKSKIIQKFFYEFSLGGLNLHSGADQLRIWGITCTNGKPLTPYMVHRILSKKTYLGLIEHKGECFEGSFKPLIDKNTFDSVQKKLKEKAKQARKSKLELDFPFKGIFKCAECGGQITAQFAKGKSGGIYRYYRCSKKFGPCKQRYVQEKVIAEQIRNRLQEVAISNEWSEIMLKEIELLQREEQSDLNLSKHKLEIDKKKIDEKMDKLVAVYLDGDLEREDYLKMKNELMKEKADLNLKFTDLGGKGKNWVEPLKNWVKTANYMGVLASPDSDYKELKSGIEKVGSNPYMRGGEIVFDFLKSYELFSIHKALEAEENKNPQSKRGLLEEQKRICLSLRRGGDSNPRYGLTRMTV